MAALKLCMPATTLGDVYSLVLYPAMSSHRALTPEQRAEVGITDGLVRLSVGIEDVDDITGDLDHAITVCRQLVGAEA
jgi:cystathionine gamma-synthase/methionine-gamma-lyase